MSPFTCVGAVVPVVRIVIVAAPLRVKDRVVLSAANRVTGSNNGNGDAMTNAPSLPEYVPDSVLRWMSFLADPTCATIPPTPESDGPAEVFDSHV